MSLVTDQLYSNALRNSSSCPAYTGAIPGVGGVLGGISGTGGVLGGILGVGGVLGGASGVGGMLGAGGVIGGISGPVGIEFSLAELVISTNKLNSSLIWLVLQYNQQINIALVVEQPATFST